MIRINVPLNLAQFGVFLAAIHEHYPQFRQQTTGLPVSRVQIMKNANCVAIKPLGGFVLPCDVEETATRFIENILADTTLVEDAEIRWSEIAQAKERAMRRPLVAVAAKRRRQARIEIRAALVA